MANQKHIDTMKDVLNQMGIEDIQDGGELLANMAAKECLFNAEDNAIDILKARVAFYKLWPFEDTTLDMVRHNGRLHFGILIH